MRSHQRLLMLVLALLAVSAAGVTGALAHGARHPRQPVRRHAASSSQDNSGGLPVNQIEAALGAQGSMINGVLSIGIERSDINDVTLHGVPIKPSFEINGELDFQPLGHDESADRHHHGSSQAFMNGDLALKPSEINPVIDAIIANGLQFQAEHQHLYDFSPMVWFIHVRGKGDPVKIAAALHKVLEATSTPLPQAPPSNPTTPLNASKLQQILHGYDAEVGSDGVVTVYVARRDPIYIDGVRVNPATNIATNIAFEPLNSQGTEAAVVPDFGMEAQEIDGVVGTMRAMGWDNGCLYNQETDEHPQLYFSHEFKTGDPYELAKEIRKGLDQTNTQ